LVGWLVDCNLYGFMCNVLLSRDVHCIIKNVMTVHPVMWLYTSYTVKRT